ncbi:polysaccharide deacetylase family protein [Gordoniibacillus kamchatkensis]|uniref:polysaccharide deacetylase family protein n=1 Tax=Gordoniibacillus kamchatkensis TaxID=1590651 RepID=UPI000696DED5|nr:polysaccharide deacetylase family protein [Paenibacillus sp. VKM B-2647]
MTSLFRSGAAIATVFTAVLALALPAASPHASAAAEGIAPGKKGRAYFENRGDIVWEVASTREKLICLTFDDGPDPEQTPAILDLLKRYGAKGTFFVTGVQALRHPELIRREVQEGHELGNHTYHHRMFRHPTAESVRGELEDAERAIAQAGGVRSRLFRPPGGYYDQTIVDAAREAGYQVVMWSWHQDTRDWSRPGVERIARKVLDNARPGDIVLFHDRVEHTQTIAALERILPELRQRDFQFVTVSELLRSAPTGGPAEQ